MDFNRPILLFDDQCTLCKRFVQLLKLIDGYHDFQYLSIDNAHEVPEFQNLEFEAIANELHLYVDGEFLIGENTVTYLIKRNSLIKKHLWLIDNQMAKRAIKSFYKAVNKSRKSPLLCGGCSRKR